MNGPKTTYVIAAILEKKGEERQENQSPSPQKESYSTSSRQTQIRRVIGRRLAKKVSAITDGSAIIGTALESRPPLLPGLRDFQPHWGQKFQNLP